MVPPAALALLLVTGAPAVRSQDGLDEARTLYAAAAYDEALALLDGLPAEGLGASGRDAADYYRMLCLIALGRTDDAASAAAALVRRNPAYGLSEEDASPRVLRLFHEARRRALPGVVRQRYVHARQLYTDEAYADAAQAFAELRVLAADADVSGNGQSLALGQVAARYEGLSRAAVSDARPPEGTTSGAEPGPGTSGAVAAPRAAEPPAEDPVGHVYRIGDRGIVPPVAIAQAVRRWPGLVRPPMAGTPLGTVQLVIDERGVVTEAAVVRSVNAFYDAALIASAKTWRYRPATRYGHPVKVRYDVSLSSR